jgi:hypothetical protein
MTAHKAPTVHHATHGNIEHPTGHHGTHHFAHHEVGSYHAHGGPIECPKDGIGPDLPGGAGGGEGRLAKAKLAAKHYAKPEGKHG